MIEVRHEPPDGPAAQALFDEYMELVRERAGPASSAVRAHLRDAATLQRPGRRWLVLYDGDAPVACGGLRPLEDGTARSSACS